MSYYGKEPCGGCGRPGSAKARSTRNDVCDDCAELIEIGKAMKGKQTGQYIRLNDPRNFFKGAQLTIWRGNGKKESSRGTGGSPYVSDAFDPKIVGDGAMCRAFCKLIKALDVGLADTIGEVYFADGGHHQHYYVTSQASEALIDLIKTINEWAYEIEHAAFMEGKNLLGGLSSGKHTLQYFDEQVARESQSYNDKRRRR